VPAVQSKKLVHDFSLPLTNFSPARKLLANPMEGRNTGAWRRRSGSPVRLGYPGRGRIYCSCGSAGDSAAPGGASAAEAFGIGVGGVRLSPESRA